MKREEFRRLASGTLILDGATGSNLMAAGMPRGVSAEHWVLEHPEVLRQLQGSYVQAGSQVVYAPTFTASRFYLKEPVADLNRRLVALSREAAPHALVAGDVTTVGRPDLSYEEMLEGYREQIEVLAGEGCDLIVIETMMAQQETMAALEAARAVCDLPVMCSFSVSSDGMLYFGGSVYEAAPALEALGADAVGINCSAGPDQLESVVRSLRECVELPVIAKPNAGLPVINDRGEAVYPMTAEDFGRSMKKLQLAGASVLGGCCGTTPAHIAALTRHVRAKEETK
ncbi:MAG: homocysteine S-methyltransferase family protein [Oscillospiraceae bacterium]|nr:homocysteine S-methyltransferase family protein [Oscillospiraceae bacterium]